MLLNILLTAAGVVWIVQTIVTLVVLVRLSKSFKVAVDQMKLDNGAQANRVDGLVKQYRALSKDYNAKVKIIDKLTDDLSELQEYVENELVEKMDEAMLSVDAILDNEWEDDEPAAQPQSVSAASQSRNNGSQNGNNGNRGGLAAVDKAANNNNNGNYSRYQELRDQGYSAKEATEIMRKEGKRG